MMFDLQALVRQGQAERQAFLRWGERASPACVELVRRAFAGEQAAWAALFTEVFQHDLLRLLEAAARRYQEQTGTVFGAEELADALQETQLAFWRYAPQAPTLLQSGELDPIIAYLKKCVMSAVSTVARKLPPPSEVGLSGLAGTEEEHDPFADERPGRKWQAPPQRNFAEEWGNVHELVEALSKILQNDLERRIANECFLNGMAPREFLVDYADLVPGENDAKKLANLNQALKRIRLRAEKSPTLQKWQSARRKSGDTAFLTYSSSTVSDVHEAMMADVESCVFDEATLLEYIQGKAAAELCAAIDRSPACVSAARHLAAEVAMWAELLQMARCPDPTTLIDYYNKELPSAEQLVVRKHVAGCRQCQMELAMFAAIDEVPLQAGPSFVRRLFEAIFLSPTLMVAPVRGALPSLHYRTQIRTPAIDILLFTQKQSGKARTWTMRGELRTEEGLHFTQVEQVVLRTVDPSTPEDAVELTTTLDADGMFVFRRLEAGVYALQLFTDQEEILIRALKVGEDE